AKKPAPIQTLPGAVSVRQLLDARFDLLLLRGLRQRVELSVRDDLGRNRRRKRVFRWLDFSELTFAQKNAHACLLAWPLGARTVKRTHRSLRSAVVSGLPSLLGRVLQTRSRPPPAREGAGSEEHTSEPPRLPHLRARHRHEKQTCRPDP